MEVQITVDGDDGAGSAYRWLSADPQVTRHADVKLAPGPAAPGTLGDPQVILAIVDTAIGLANLGVALKTWADSRPRREPPAIHITVNQVVYRSVDDLRRRLGDGDES